MITDELTITCIYCHRQFYSPFINGIHIRKCPYCNLNQFITISPIESCDESKECGKSITTSKTEVPDLPQDTHLWVPLEGTPLHYCQLCKVRGDDSQAYEYCKFYKGPKRIEDYDDLINSPPHYTSHPSGVECIDIVEHFNFCVGNAIKYLWQAGLKGDILEDLKKARWYIDREIARVEKEGGITGA